MKPAPSFDCVGCGRTIGLKASHYVIEGDHVVCERCLSDTHGKLLPDCPSKWHDVLDHMETVGGRGAVARHLGIWP